MIGAYPTLVQSSSLRPAASIICRISFGEKHWGENPGSSLSVEGCSALFPFTRLKQSSQPGNNINAIRKIRFVVDSDNSQATGFEHSCDF